MFWLNTKINLLQIFGLVITFLGVLIVVSKANFNLLFNLQVNDGDLIMIFACIFYAVYAVGLKKKPNVSNLVLMTFFSYIAFLGSLPGLIYEISFGEFLLPTVKGVFILLVIIIFPSFLAQIFFIKGVEKLGPSTSGLYTNLVPIFTAILAVIILNESFYFYHLISLFVVFLGIYIFERK
tara:strand:- start:154 stop:693 length:540 start_codon:yes stop_codon:yes gene_type:complete